jgi:hypothetical protein
VGHSEDSPIYLCVSVAVPPLYYIGEPSSSTYLMRFLENDTIAFGSNGIYKNSYLLDIPCTFLQISSIQRSRIHLTIVVLFLFVTILSPLFGNIFIIIVSIVLIASSRSLSRGLGSVLCLLLSFAGLFVLCPVFFLTVS